MALPKAHHIETLSEFNSLKFSYDSTNTHYFTGGTDTVVEGTPDILYTDIAYIKPLSAIYTHAKIYPCPVLEYDNAPTAGSDNLVTSDGIKTAIDGVTYTAGTGLKLSNNQFSLNVPRVAKSANSLPGVNSAMIENYASGENYNLPTTNNYYNIITIQGSQSTYATQLAMASNSTAVFYRSYIAGVWQDWLRLDNPTMDSTPTAGHTSNVVSSDGIKTYVDTQVSTKSNVIFRQWVTA